MINYGTKTFTRTSKAFSIVNLTKDNACGSAVDELVAYAKKSFSKEDMANFAINGISNDAFCGYFLRGGAQYIDWLINHGYLADTTKTRAASATFALGTIVNIVRTNGEYITARVKVGYNKYAWALINMESGKAKVDPTVFTDKDTQSLTAEQFKKLLGKDVGEYNDIVASMAD